MSANVKWFSSLGMGDLEEVGGKNSSLGEMIGSLASAGVRVPDGFATTASAFRDFVSQEGLAGRITGLMEGLDTDDVEALARVGKQVRQAIVEQPLQPALEQQVRDAYATLSEGDEQASFAVRSSATAEDLPDASFAGQQETFLNIRGIDAVLRAMDKADVVLIAPSRCGKTPTTMYLALQHGLFVANYPLVEEDLQTTELPRPIRHLKDRVIGLVATPARLSEVRQQRRPNSRYASLEQCTYELRRAEAMYAANRLPVINSTTKSVEEMSTLIVQTLSQRTPEGKGASA